MPPRDTSFPAGNDELLRKGSCPSCGSSDANAFYADGHTHCFACGTNGSAEGLPAERRAPGKPSAALLKPEAGAFKGLSKRGLTEKTLRQWGYFVGHLKGEAVQVAPYFDQDGEPAGQKLRLPNKDFLWLKAREDAPGTGDCRLFGRHVFGDRYDRRVVITEGEIDAMTIAQVEDSKYAVVSVAGGAKGAAKNIKANYLWLDRFADIVLWFDNDEPGNAAAEECAKLFKVGKVRIAKAPDGFKDASDLMQANRPGDITTAVYTATKWRPQGIVNAKDTPEDVCAPKEDSAAFSFNWHRPSWQEMLGPILPAQVVYHVAGTGIGKTTDLAELVYDLTMRQGAKVAYLGFEDTRRDLKLRLMSIHAGRRLDIDPLPDADMLRLHEEVFGRGLLELFDPETAEWTMDAILGYVRYCAKALDCQVVIADPLSFVAAGIDARADERRALDTVSKDFAQASKELGINMQVSHHLSRPEGTPHEEGAATSLNQVRGSGGIANFASIVIGHERNTQAEGDGSLITQHRALKNRPRSRTGVMGRAKYDLKTGRLPDTDEPFPGPTSRSGRGAQPGGSFPPAGTQDY